MAPIDFHPTVDRWFNNRFGEPTPPQLQGWPLIRRGSHTLIAAPTGSGKTLAAFLSAIDQLLRKGPGLRNTTAVLYLSPLKALGNDIRHNLLAPLEELRSLDLALPEIRVQVRTGDTTPRERNAMRRTPPHILVSTPESLYILLTSEGGREMLKSLDTVIVDEIHALAGNKRGVHLALSLERLEALAGPFQRIGLSATQNPIEETAAFLGGVGRRVEIVDTGHFRNLDLAVEVPRSPLRAVCSNETWEEIYDRIAELIEDHRSTLVFVNTRRLAERIAARLTQRLGAEKVSCHHGSLSKDRRFEAEQRLRAGRLKALVATASLELGIDVGDVELTIQVGSARSISTLLQRVGRSGHGRGRTPKGRLFPLTLDELLETAGALRAIEFGRLDRIVQPPGCLAILAQQIVAACVDRDWGIEELYALLVRAWPFRRLTREELDDLIQLHTSGRKALLHLDGVNARLRSTRRARLPAITAGGAIPDAADFQVVTEPEGTFVGTLNEDFAIESSSGDIFQLGNTSWRILRVEPGRVRVADAEGVPPTVPFWLGEAPGRTTELSVEIGRIRQGDLPSRGFPSGAEIQVQSYLNDVVRALGRVPDAETVVAERFFDETGGMQLVIHSLFGSRINRAWGLALRKRFCRGFGFELQAAANEEAILISLGPQHSFPLEEVFRFLNRNSVRDLLIQALLDAPMFQTRWRWNVNRSLVVPRTRGGKRIPPAILRMLADDALVQAFPQAAACFETLPPGDIPVPMEHPLVRQTVEDCLHEAMDLDGLLDLLGKIEDGTIRTHAVDLPEPSPLATGILSAQPYAFLDDGPLEERRTQAVLSRRGLEAKTADELGALDPEAIRRVREEAWPQPGNSEEVHESLLWMGFVTVDEARNWAPWLEELARQGRVVREGERWFATEASREPAGVMRGRLEALGPIFSDDPVLFQLEKEGCAMRCRLNGQMAWCDRRLLARIHRYTLDRLRREIQPVSAADFLRFLACWQHLDEEYRLEGPNGVAEVLRQLAGFEVPASAWESRILRARVRDYRPEWLDQLTLGGEFVWLRLWGSGTSPVRTIPIAFVHREDLGKWLALPPQTSSEAFSSYAREVYDYLLQKGPVFLQDLRRELSLLPSHLERGLSELIGRGRLSADSFASIRQLLTPPSRRRSEPRLVGRISILDRSRPGEADAEFVARRLLHRTGVVFRRTLLRERQPLPWRDLLRVLRLLELRGEIRGGRFVEGFAGEQFALPEAVELLRALRRRGKQVEMRISAADPLNFQGILTPQEKVSPQRKQLVPLV